MPTITFSEKNGSIKDVESLGSRIKNIESEELAEVLTLEFGLSEQRSEEVAKIKTSYDKISSNRELTLKERNQMTMRLLGVDLKSAKNALERRIQGSNEDYNMFIERSSEFNNIDPEALTEMVSEILF